MVTTLDRIETNLCIYLKTDDFLECNILKTWDMEKKHTIEYPIKMKEIPSDISNDPNNAIEFIHFDINDSNDYPICAMSLGYDEFIEHNIQIKNEKDLALVSFEIKGKTRIKKRYLDMVLDGKLNANLRDIQFPNFIKFESVEIEYEWDQKQTPVNIKCSKNLKGLN